MVKAYWKIAIFFKEGKAFETLRATLQYSLEELLRISESRVSLKNNNGNFIIYQICGILKNDK